VIARATMLFALACVVVTTACARRFVVHPSEVQRLNDPAWTITHEPAKAPPAAASAAPAPQPTAE